MANWFNKKKSDTNKEPIISKNSKFYVMGVETVDSDGRRGISNSVFLGPQKEAKYLAIEEDGRIIEFVTGIPIVLKSRVEEMFNNSSFTELREISKNCIEVDKLTPIDTIGVARSLSLLSDYGKIERYRDEMHRYRDAFARRTNSRVDIIESAKKEENYITQNADSIINEFVKKYRPKR